MRDSLPTWVLQVFGLATFTFFCVFWAFTGRVEPTLLAAAGTLYGAGLVQRAAGLLRDQDPPPPTTAAAASKEDGS